MARVFLIVMDSAGCGGAPDAVEFFNGSVPDTGANTLAHIAQACTDGTAEEGRSGPLSMPNLARLGLGAAIRLASGDAAPGLDVEATGLWGAATEQSRGKDTPSGHWELAGVPVPWDWHYFPDARPSFPAELSEQVARCAGTDGILGNCHASGTQIIAELGDAHIRTGWPICYTSADSVFQIAAHETHFGLERLLQLCRDIAPVLHDMRVGRVIARPFVGDAQSGFTRTTNRRDFAVAPPAPTICDRVQAAGGKVLEYVDTPIADTSTRMGPLTTSLLQKYGDSWTHALAINDLYFDFMGPALASAGISAADGPQAGSAGDGSEAAFQRIRTGGYQTITVAEPLNLQGWQLVDELNRAVQGEACSGYVTSPALVTQTGLEKMGDSNAFDPDTPYREAYSKIWGK